MHSIEALDLTTSAKHLLALLMAKHIRLLVLNQELKSVS